MICVVIANYDFSDNADHLKREFSDYIPTIIIDASSPKPPKSVDFTVANTYYPGLWNAAVSYASSSETGCDWLMFVASDLQIPDVGLLCSRAIEAIKMKTIGIYTPSLTLDSRLSFLDCFNAGTASIREVQLVEGFFFLTRVRILKSLYPIPMTNKYGWGIDVAACYAAYKMGYTVVVDDGVEIFHPKRIHDIDETQAGNMHNEYVGKEICHWRNCAMIKRTRRSMKRMSSKTPDAKR